MNHPFDLDNFESFLSEQADQHRMYASDSVWRKIQERLHGKDRWPALTFGAILTTSVIAVVLTFTYPQKRLFNSPADYSSIAKVYQPAAKEAARVKHTQNHPTVKAVTVAPVALLPVSATDLSVNYNNGASSLQQFEGGPDSLLFNAVAGETPLTDPAPLQAANGIDAHSYQGKSIESLTGGAENEMLFSGKPWANRLNNEENYINSVDFTNAGISATPEKQEKVLAANETMSRNSFIEHSMKVGPKKPGKTISGKNRWLVQFYATPSISYRYMLEDKKFISDPSAANGPIAPYLTNPASDFVQHKPKLGLEAGTAFLYQLTDNFRLKTGFQVNYRQYGIQAYAVNAQPARLTLIRDHGVDSIVRFSSLSSQSGFKSMNLSSNFLQLAVPLGFDMKIADTRSVDFYVSASGQFTYQLASSYYILSDDYKNYLKQPDIDRKFNINTAVEAFASFEAGGITWQAGPQIRYQLLPGSMDVYPIREHLIDYGFKIGVVKKLK